MPRQYYYITETIYLGGEQELRLGGHNSWQSSTCRDSGLSCIIMPTRNAVLQRLGQLSRDMPAVFRSLGQAIIYEDNTMAALHAWVRANHQHLKFTVSTMLHHSRKLEDFSIGRIIDRLHRKFPSVRFETEQGRYGAGFDGTLLIGIKMTGDAQVIPAFYWSNLLMRLSEADQNPRARNDRPWKDVSELLNRSDGSNGTLWGSQDDRTAYIAIWDQYRQGNPGEPGWQSIMTGGGPKWLYQQGALERRGILGNYERLFDSWSADVRQAIERLSLAQDNVDPDYDDEDDD